MQNHPRLDGRLTVHDPDAMETPAYAVEYRRHGTQMASLIIWGDLDSGETPLDRPLLVRPVLEPDPTRQNQESFRDEALIPDLMERVFRELFGSDGAPGVAPDIRIVNLSLGDPFSQFGIIPSAWARTIDWLSHEYEVLVVVSAGNHPTLQLQTPRVAFEAAPPEDRRQAVLEALAAGANDRRLLAPAEAINALTVGAFHDDSAGAHGGTTYSVDALAGSRLPSVISAIGRGVRRSVKPEIHAPGGRQFFSVDPTTAAAHLRSVRSPLPPGLKAASPRTTRPLAGELYTRGTSGAAALTSRRGALLHERIVELQTGGAAIERRHEAPALKALLTHGADWRAVDAADLVQAMEAKRWLAYGSVTWDPWEEPPPNRVTLLSVGDLGAGEEQDVLIPLPPSLSAIRGKRRITLTLAWLSPINWRHRQYRRAKLSFQKPSGMPVAASASATDINVQAAQRGTVQHQVFESVSAVPIGPDDSIETVVACVEQAGGLSGERVPYALAVSLEVAPELGVDVHAEVAARVKAAVAVPVSASSP